MAVRCNTFFLWHRSRRHRHPDPPGRRTPDWNAGHRATVRNAALPNWPPGRAAGHKKSKLAGRTVPPKMARVLTAGALLAALACAAADGGAASAATEQRGANEVRDATARRPVAAGGSRSLHVRMEAVTGPNFDYFALVRGRGGGNLPASRSGLRGPYRRAGRGAEVPARGPEGEQGHAAKVSGAA